MDHQLLNFPEMAFIRQKLFRSDIENVAGAVRSSLQAVPEHCHSNTGSTVAVAVGSRKIDGLKEIVYQCLRFLEHRGFKPYIVPAMGSHGGATAEGQKHVLASYGVTEEAMGVPIAADMAVRCIATHPLGFSLYMSTAALAADHIVLINRIKPHTKFKADIESGLCKMLTVGLGKHQGAAEFHQRAVDHTFGIIESAAAILLEKTKILFGVAVLEDGYGKLAHVETLLPDSLILQEKMLLKKAAGMMGSIPFDLVDILIVDQIGKDISGIGMDSNVTGRHRDIVGDTMTAPHVKRIFVRDLSDASDGNANGIGLADFTTRRLVDRMDREKTYVNSLAAISPEKAAIPVYFDTDRQCLDACARTSGRSGPGDLRVVRIKNTSSLEYFQVSRALEKEVNLNRDLSFMSPWQAFIFDPSDNLTEFPIL
ncbi:MAG: DUF362 domain-containing protein [Desulfobacteraceae bacterium]|nr:MAG: DUF362 domain-containing protein [Desulfobacteraceae bacterium]